MKTPSKASANWYRGFERAGNLIKDEMANAKHKIIANGDETLWQHTHECLSLDKNMTPTTKPKGIRIHIKFMKGNPTHILIYATVCE